MIRMQLLCPDGDAAGGASQPNDAPTNNDRIAAAEKEAATAIAHYRRMVAAAPGLIAEMVQGSTVEEIDASAEAARQAYINISRRITEQHEQAISPGNPPRSAQYSGAESLKPEAKIALGLKGK